MENVRNHLVLKRLFFCLMTGLLIIIDWTRGSLGGEVWLGTVNLIGPVLVAILAVAWGIKGFVSHKWAYAVWLLIGLIVGFVTKAYVYSHPMMLDKNQVICAAMGAWSLGFVYIRLFLECFIDKIRSLRYSVSSVCLGVMFALALFAVNEDIWPLYYLFCFFPVYQIMPDVSDQTKTAVQKGTIDAILIMFFVIQGHAFVLRPFDHEDARYCGFYANANINALFYTIVYVAFLLRGMELSKKTEQTLMTRLFRLGCFLFGAAMWGFGFLTGCRTAFVTMLGVSVVFLIFGEIRYLRVEILGLAVKSTLFLAVGLVSIYIDFVAVRYIPPLFHHPIWFQGEYSEDKVHSWDPWDSDKYVSYDCFADRLMERYGFDIRFVTDGIQAQALEKSQGESIVENDIETTSPFLPTRKDVWAYYLKQGNLTGHSNLEGHDIFSGMNAWYVWHAQNMFLQYWYYYGIPTALFFALWLVVSGMRALLKTQSDQPQLNIMILCFLTLFAVYGLTEAVWYQGQLIWSLALFLPALNEKGYGDRL